MALEWLKQNNKYYHDINLDESALTQLPEDGNLNGLSMIVMSLDDDDHVNDSAPLDDDTFMSGTFVPMVPRKETEQNVIRQSISSRQHTNETHGIVQWPQVANIPINEFKTEGYML